MLFLHVVTKKNAQVMSNPESNPKNQVKVIPKNKPTHDQSNPTATSNPINFSTKFTLVIGCGSTTSLHGSLHGSQF